MYVVIPFLQVQALNAEAAYCISGHPGPGTFIGFAHALLRRSGVSDAARIIPVFHTFRLRSSKAYGEHVHWMQRSSDRDTKRSRAAKAETQLDLPRADATLSVVMDLATECDGQRLHDAITRMRLAGGTIVDMRAPETHFEFERAIKSVPPGFFMQEVQSASDDSPFDAIVNACAYDAPHWITPTLVGYHLISSPTERVNARGGYPHAYADPLIGIVRWQSKTRASPADCWRYTRHGDEIRFETDNAFLLQSNEHKEAPHAEENE